MSKRLLPDSDYAYPDSRNIRIQELEAQLMLLRAAYAVARKRLKKWEPKKKGKK